MLQVELEHTLNRTDTPNNSNTDSKEHSSHSYIIGIICIIIIVMSWIALIEITPLLSSNFTKPYFLSYFASSSAILMIIPWFIIEQYNKKK